MKIIALESSCDESGVAVFDSKYGVVENLIHSQIDLHALYGGVVPDLASREHLRKIPALIEKSREFFDGADLVAVTSGPGLPNCLAMGIAGAEGLALALNLPLAGVNHLRGHAYSPFIGVHSKDPENFGSNFEKLLPHLGLAVSGGNTVLFEISRDKKILPLADTLDDAAGEALDKGAKLLGIPYPGAPVIERLSKIGNPKKINFPCGKNRKIDEDPDFSFSGLKTSLRYYLEKNPHGEKDLPDICASYQFAVVEQLKLRAEHFAKKKKYSSIGLSGGVSNNSLCAETFEKIAKKSGAEFLVPDKQYRGDNAAMIAFAAYVSPESTRPSKDGTATLDPSWEIA